MSERKALNRWIPYNFDPEKVPKGPRRTHNFIVRLMLPFSLRCLTCQDYIYKGKKFNARKEIVWGEEYLGIRVYRFYIKCPQCAAEISFKTDPKNSDYICEAGAMRNFEPWRREAEETAAEKEARLKEEELNPIKALENRTQDSKRELELAEALDDIRTLNARNERLDFDVLEEVLKEEHEEETENERVTKKRLQDEDEEDKRIAKEAFREAKMRKEEQNDFNSEPSAIVKPLLTSIVKNNHKNPMMPKKLLAKNLGIVIKKKAV